MKFSILLSLIISTSACATTKEIPKKIEKPVTNTGVFQCNTANDAYMEAIIAMAKHCLQYEKFATVYPNPRRYRCKDGGVKFVFKYQCLKGETNENF
jgi:hypothetical protein